MWQATGVPEVHQRHAIFEGERLVATAFRPRYLPDIRVTEFNYPIAIGGK